MKRNPAMVYHMMVEAMKLAYGDRANIADPKFQPQVKQVYMFIPQVDLQKKVIEGFRHIH